MDLGLSFYSLVFLTLFPLCQLFLLDRSRKVGHQRRLRRCPLKNLRYLRDCALLSQSRSGGIWFTLVRSSGRVFDFLGTCSVFHVCDRQAVGHSRPRAHTCNPRALRLQSLEVCFLATRWLTSLFHFWFKTLNSGPMLPDIFIQQSACTPARQPAPLWRPAAPVSWDWTYQDDQYAVLHKQP